MSSNRNLYNKFEGQFEDFWQRRPNRPLHSHRLDFMGFTVEFLSNQASLLDAASLARQLYSLAPAVPQKEFRIELIVQAGLGDPGPAPEDIFATAHYSGSGGWLMIRLGDWAQAYANLEAGYAAAVLDPNFAERPDLVSRGLLHTILINFFTRHGSSMLHASGLRRKGRNLLLVAPHDTGKSTTALRLIQAGYRLISDSMVFVRSRPAGLELSAFPARTIKLRADMLDSFPELAGHLKLERVQRRTEIKHSLDLGAVYPERVCLQALPAAPLEICLLSRSGGAQSRLQPVPKAELLDAIMLNSLHYDNFEVWDRNLGPLRELLDIAGCHRLEIGTEPEGILETVASLF